MTNKLARTLKEAHDPVKTRHNELSNHPGYAT
jgi:hypothetical protein